MKRTIYFLLFAILLVSILTYGTYQKYKQFEKYKNDKTDLKKYINKFHKIFLQKGQKYKIPFTIYYINMDKDVHRLESLMNEQRYIDAKMTRIRGFNGKLIKNRKGDTIEGTSFVNYYKDLSNSEIGCCISHLKAIDTAWTNGDEIAMIIEDDISFSSTAIIPQLEDFINKAPFDWEIIQLVSFGNNFDPTVYSDDVTYIKRSYPDQAFWSCGCYIINRRGMEKIIKVIKPNPSKNLFVIQPIRPATFTEISNATALKHTYFSGFPLYGVSDGYIYDLVNTYSTSPSLFIVNNSEIDSTMHTDHTDYHVANALTTAKSLEQLYLK